MLNARSVKALAERAGVEMPICDVVHAVLYDGLDITNIRTLFSERPLRSNRSIARALNAPGGSAGGQAEKAEQGGEQGWRGVRARRWPARKVEKPSPSVRTSCTAASERAAPKAAPTREDLRPRQVGCGQGERDDIGSGGGDQRAPAGAVFDPEAEEPERHTVLEDLLRNELISLRERQFLR